MSLHVIPDVYGHIHLFPSFPLRSFSPPLGCSPFRALLPSSYSDLSICLFLFLFPSVLCLSPLSSVLHSWRRLRRLARSAIAAISFPCLVLFNVRHQRWGRFLVTWTCSLPSIGRPRSHFLSPLPSALSCRLLFVAILWSTRLITGVTVDHITAAAATDYYPMMADYFRRLAFMIVSLEIIIITISGYEIFLDQRSPQDCLRRCCRSQWFVRVNQWNVNQIRPSIMTSFNVECRPLFDATWRAEW